MKLHLLSVLALSLGFALACSGGTPTETPPPPPPPADGSIGVQECDDYIKKVEDCLGKLPAEAKGAVEGSLKANRDAWAQAAATPQGKTALSTGCKMAVDTFTCPDIPAMPTGAADGTGAATGTTAAGPATGAAGAAVGATAAGGAASGDTKTEEKVEEKSTSTRSTATPGSGRFDPKPQSMERSRSGGGSRDGGGAKGGSTGGTSSGSSGSGADKPRTR
jgi:hypothetical protein